MAAQFDINEVLAGMMTAMRVSIGEDWPMVGNQANEYMESKKVRLELLANIRIMGGISDEFFKERLEDEKKILESELHSIAVIGKVIAQNAANAAIDVLEKAVMVAIKAAGI